MERLPKLPDSASNVSAVISPIILALEAVTSPFALTLNLEELITVSYTHLTLPTTPYV